MIFGELYKVPGHSKLEYQCDLCGKKGISDVEALRKRTKKYYGRIFCGSCAKLQFIKQGRYDLAKSIIETLRNNPLQHYSDIAQGYGVTQRQVETIAKIIGLNGIYKRRQDVLLEFFQSNTPEKWWVIGWLVTDGCVYSNGTGKYYCLRLEVTDKEIIDKIVSILPVPLEIRNRIPPQSEGCKNECARAYSFQFKLSNELKKLLAQYSITPNKSKTSFVPIDLIPKEMRLHYVRGVIEGDGCFTQHSKTLFISTGSKDFANQITELIDSELGTNARIYHAKKGYFQIQYSSEDTLKIHQWIYPPNLPDSVSLMRKKDYPSYHIPSDLPLNHALFAQNARIFRR